VPGALSPRKQNGKIFLDFRIVPITISGYRTWEQQFLCEGEGYESIFAIE
jgi:hypothetical protein